MVVRAYFHYAKAARGGEKVLEKTNYYIHHLDKIFTTFPLARCLVIFRHPVDTYTSYLRRGIVEDKVWLKKTKEQFCDLWESNMSVIHKKRERICAVPYEDLTGNPQQTFKKICQYLEISFEPMALEESAPDIKRLPVDPYVYAPIVPKTKDWKDYLSQKDAYWIECRLKNLMSTFGYKSHTENIK